MAYEYKVHILNVPFALPTIPNSGEDVPEFDSRLSSLASHGWRFKQLVPIDVSAGTFMVILEREKD